MIQLKQLNKQALYEFIYSPEYMELEHIPISRHRALSHINNPRANDDDILLILAYEGAHLVGYLGMLPEKIYHENSYERCAWLSCLWVDTRFRGRRIGSQLVQDSLDAWEGRILITEYTEAARRLYEKLGSFVELDKKQGVRLYIRSELSKILPPKRKIFQQSKPALQMFDTVFNFFFDVRFAFYRRSQKKHRIEYVNFIDDSVDQFIAARQQTQLFKRRAEELNWLLKNPWILSAPEKDEWSQKYHFSAVAKSFDFVPIKIYNSENELIAFLIFAKRDDGLKLPYCYYSGSVQVVVDVINFHLVKWRIKTFTVYHQPIAQALKKNKTPALYKKQITRAYLISSVLAGDWLQKEKEIQDGDGDCSFT